MEAVLLLLCEEADYLKTDWDANVRRIGSVKAINEQIRSCYLKTQRSAGW